MGIGSFIGAISLIGFVLFLIGAATVVVNASQGKSARGGVLLAIVGILIGIIFSVISQGVVVVQASQVAVVFNTLNGDLETPRGSGTQIIIPVIQQATIYDFSQQQYTMSGIQEEGAVRGDDQVRGRTQDGQEVGLDVTVLFGINPDGENPNIVHRRWQNRYINDFIRPTTRGLVRDGVSGFRAAEIYGQQRSALEDEIQLILSESMAREGLLLTDFVVRDIAFSPEFAASIEQAQIAQQETEQARLRVQQREQEAEQVRVQAGGQRDAAIARAEGEAQSIILRAQAEAEALRLVSQQIAANPLLIQYQYIQTLGPNVSLAIIPSDSPFLFDFESIAANPDFMAPEVPQSDLVLPTPVPQSEVTPTPGS